MSNSSKLDKPAVRAYMWGKSSLPCGTENASPGDNKKTMISRKDVRLFLAGN
jgi:hypothetical protein